MILFFDTETSGLPLRRNASYSDTSNWPRLVQLAWIQYDINGRLLDKSTYIIRPSGFIIPKDAAAIHGISHERAMREGVPLERVLLEFRDAIRHSHLLVAHNYQFDFPVLNAEFIRSRLSHEMEKKQSFCTMMSTKNLLRIPHPNIRNDYKWPKLEELHRYLFNTGFADAHNAATDVEITAKCFWELHNRNLININLPKPLSTIPSFQTNNKAKLLIKITEFFKKIW